MAFDFNDFSKFTVRQLKASAVWMAKAAAVREAQNTPKDNAAAAALLKRRDFVLAELSSRSV